MVRRAGRLWLGRPAACLVAFLLFGTSALAEPADTLAALWDTLGACARILDVPPSAAGSDVTVLFSLTRSGALQGKPRITHARLVGSAGDQRAFIGAALAAVSRCLPLDITDALGGAIAGRPLRFRITSHRPERAL